MQSCISAGKSASRHASNVPFTSALLQTTCSQHILVGTLSAGHSHDSELHADCYVSSVICVVLMLLIFMDRSVLNQGVIGKHSQYM